MPVINIQDSWQWWVLAAARLLPRHDSFLELASRRCTQVVQTGAFYKLARNAGAGQPVSQLTFAHEAADPVAICGHLQSGEDVVVSIDIKSCFSRLVILPRAAAARIEAILDLDLARLTPFARDSVFSGWIERGTSGDGRTLEIEHLVVRRDIVARIFDAIGQSGATPIGLIVRDDTGQTLPLALSPGGRPFGGDALKRWARITSFGVALLLLGLFVLAGAIDARQSRVETAIAGRIASVQADAAEVRERVDAIGVQSAEISALLARRAEMSGRILMIEELSRILPDGASLDGLSVEAGRLVVDGAAIAPEGLIAALEASPLFKSVSLNSPVYRNPGEQVSRFSVKLELERPSAAVRE